MDVSLSNKVVLVTGASSGIGKATAILFASRGARLALVARDIGRLRAVAAACAEYDRQHLIIIADLATDKGCERAAKETLEHFGRLDVLVNNAAIFLGMSLETADMESFDRVFNTDVRGVFNLTRLLAPTLIEAKGNIVNVSSVAANVVAPTILPYSMAKAALDQFTRQIAFELAPKGVRVNTISPGITETRVHQRNTGCSDEEYEAWIKSQGQRIPLGQVCQPEHIAKMIVFIASEDCELVTGNIVKVDGGVSLKT